MCVCCVCVLISTTCNCRSSAGYLKGLAEIGFRLSQLLCRAGGLPRSYWPFYGLLHGLGLDWVSARSRGWFVVGNKRFSSFLLLCLTLRGCSSYWPVFGLRYFTEVGPQSLTWSGLCISVYSESLDFVLQGLAGRFTYLYTGDR